MTEKNTKLTTTGGAPVPDNQNSKTAKALGIPLTDFPKLPEMR